MKCKAYLTIYLALSLTVMLSVVMVLLMGVKKNTIRMEEELALNTAGWSALAEYHQELFRQYDLFFIDTSYGSGFPEIEALGEHVKDYANKPFSVDFRNDFYSVGYGKMRGKINYDSK